MILIDASMVWRRRLSLLTAFIAWKASGRGRSSGRAPVVRGGRQRKLEGQKYERGLAWLEAIPPCQRGILV